MFVRSLKIAVLTLTLSCSVFSDCWEVERKIARAFMLSAEKREKVEPAYPSVLIPDGHLKRALKTDLLPLLSQGVQGSMTGVDGVRLSYSKWEVPNEKGAVVFVPGMMETYLYHPELIHDLVKSGYSLYVMDPRGQGLSERLASNPQIVHVEKFSDYVVDLQKFIQEVVRQKPHQKVFGLGYSMGGLITTLTAHKNPEFYDAFAAVAPPYGIQTKGIPKPLAKLITWARIAVGKRKEYVLYGHDRPYDAPLAHYRGSNPRSEISAEIMRASPSLYMGGPSNGWLSTTFAASEEAQRAAASFYTPSLLIGAGKDTVVIPQAIYNFTKRSPLASLLRLPDSSHSIFVEPAYIRHAAVSDILRFYIHPEHPNAPIGETEVPRLIAEAEDFLQKGDAALARYTMDEAVRIYHTNKTSLPQGGEPTYERDLLEKSRFFWKALEESPDSVQTQYVNLAARRDDELKKILGNGDKKRETP